MSSNKKSPEPSGPAQLVVGTFLDTTWRMFVPSIGLTLLGVWLDGQFGTKPWLMAAGIVLGLTGAFLLVRQQFQGVKKQKGTK